MFRKKAIFFIGIACLCSCQTLVMKQDFLEIKKIGFLSLNINKESVFKANYVQYPSVSFVAMPFYNAFVKTFNKQSDRLKLISFSEKNFDKKNQTYLVDKFQKSTGVSQMAWMFDEASFNGDEKKNLLTFWGVEGALVLTLKTSVWDQEMAGFLTIKNNEDKVLWKQEFRMVSKYIVADKHSPYLISENEKSFILADSSHKQEIVKIYEELAKNLANDFFKKYKRRFGLHKKKI